MRTPRSTSRTAIRQPRAVLPGPVQLLGRNALAADVEHVRGLGLHAIGGLHHLDGALDLRVLLLQALHVQPVQLLDQVHLAALAVPVHLLAADVGDQPLRVEVVLDPRHLVGDVGALVDGRQEGVAPERRAHDGGLVRAEHHESGQVPVLAPEPVR